MGFAIDGLVSGFDTTTIIESLLGFQETQINTLNSRQEEIAVEQTAFRGVEAQLLTLQGSLARLGRSVGSVFEVNTATSSNEDVLQAAAGSDAIPATFNLTVESLATAEQRGSQGIESTTTELAQGEVTFQIGSQSTTITIDGSNNTIDGIVSTINDNVDGLSASTIFDQGSQSFRLLLTGDETGAGNSIVVTSNTSGAGEVLDFSGEPIEAASDATIRLGSGPGAISASFATNVVDDLIEDVTLNLQSADPGSTVTINIARDTGPATEAIQEFVDDFNSVQSFIDEQTRFDPATGQGSPLLGNRSVTEIQNQLRSIVIGTVEGVQGANRLERIGIDINIAGQLTLDSARLQEVLSGQAEDVELDEVAQLFGLNGSSNNTGIEFLLGSDRTASSPNPIEVNITQAAEQASVTSANAIANSVVIDDSNNTFQVTINGITSEELTIDNGTFTAEEFATEVERLINGSSELGNNDVFVGINASNQLTITSELFGSRSEVSQLTGTAAAAIGFDGSESDSGSDVVGQFIVDGVPEQAIGVGQLLSGDSDNANTADLQVRVTLDSSDVSAATEGELLVTRGITGALNQFIDSLLDPDTGAISNVNEEFEQRIESIEVSIENVQAVTDSRRESLIQEFAALESILNELRTTGDFLASQFASLSAAQSNNN